MRKAETVLRSQPVLDAAGERPAVLTVIRVPLAECCRGLGAARALYTGTPLFLLWMGARRLVRASVLSVL